MAKNNSLTAILDVQSHGFAEAAQDRFGRSSAATMGLPSWLSRDRRALDFLGVAAYLLLWVALWSLLIFAYQCPLETAGLDAPVTSTPFPE
jgi:hypothetical protein